MTVETWSEIERQLRAMPLPAVAGFAARAAERSLPWILELEPMHGTVAFEWFHATATTVRVVQAFAAGRVVSPFSRQLAAEFSRVAAAATAAAAGRSGLSAAMGRAELAYAAAAFAADASRASTADRAATLAMQAARAAAEGGPIPSEQVNDLQRGGGVGYALWMASEPEAWRRALTRYELHEAGLPQLFPEIR